MEFSNQDNKLSYPRPWIFKLIGADLQGLATATAAVLAEREHTFESSHRSKNGTYFSATVNLRVETEEDRNALFTAFAERPEVKVVI